MNFFYIDSTMPQAGIDPSVQSHSSYEASALPPSHHSRIKSILTLPHIAMSLQQSCTQSVQDYIPLPGQGLAVHSAE